MGRRIAGKLLRLNHRNRNLIVDIFLKQSKGRRRQVGWFPATYVKILAGGKMSGRSTPLSSSKINLHETVIGGLSICFFKTIFTVFILLFVLLV